MVSLAIVVPELAKYGGAERLILECVSRWQDDHEITLYSSIINEKLLSGYLITVGDGNRFRFYARGAIGSARFNHRKTDLKLSFGNLR